MKLVRADKERFTFSLAAREKKFLLAILGRYPLVSGSHHRLSQGGRWRAQSEDQQLLDEALAARRRENRERIVAMLNEPGRFRKVGGAIELSLGAEEMNWLLEVLNDVRVGAWLALGEPEEPLPREINETNAPYVFAMEGAGMLESALLAAFGIRERKSWGGI